MKKNTWIQLRISPEQKAIWVEKSMQARLPLSAWITKKLNENCAEFKQFTNESKTEVKDVN